jgi:hypothetical protein
MGIVIRYPDLELVMLIVTGTVISADFRSGQPRLRLRLRLRLRERAELILYSPPQSQLLLNVDL